MKTIVFQTILLLSFFSVTAQWKPAGDKIKTSWAETMDTNKVLDEYPRPIMKRNS